MSQINIDCNKMNCTLSVQFSSYNSLLNNENVSIKKKKFPFE